MTVEKQPIKVAKNGDSLEMDLVEAFGGEKKAGKKSDWDKKNIAFLVSGIVGIIGGVVCLAVGILGGSKVAGELKFSQINDEKDEESFARELKNIGLNNTHKLFSTSFYPMQKRRVRDSWKKLFTSAEGCPEEYLQAAVWELKKEWLLEVRNG